MGGSQNRSSVSRVSGSQTEDTTSEEYFSDPPDDFEEARFCRICRLSDELLVENVCNCKGSMGQIHERCLRLWTIYQRSQICEICRSKFRWNFDDKHLSVKTGTARLVWNFVRRRYFWVLVRDMLNFMVLFGVSVLQNARILSMIQEEQPGRVDPALPVMVIGACFYDMYFSRWVMNRTTRAYNMIREYWVLAHDVEFLGYFNEEYAVFGENQSEIETMLLAEYDAPD